ncbi:hypothetical protein [Mycobacterium innocens]|nr:hypothetical protein [Mycobacterium innocens]
MALRRPGAGYFGIEQASSRHRAGIEQASLGAEQASSRHRAGIEQAPS